MKVENLLRILLLTQVLMGGKNKKKDLSLLQLFSYSFLNKLLMASFEEKKDGLEKTTWAYHLIQSSGVIDSPSRRL